MTAQRQMRVLSQSGAIVGLSLNDGKAALAGFCENHIESRSSAFVIEVHINLFPARWMGGLETLNVFHEGIARDVAVKAGRCPDEFSQRSHLSAFRYPCPISQCRRIRRIVSV